MGGPNFTRERFALLLGILFAIALIFFQFYFYELRLLIDNSINLFMISVEKTFHASENRFMKIFTQILPVMGARLDVPFSWLPKLYLANDALWYIFGFGVLFFYFKDYEACFALVIGLFAAWKYYFFIIPCGIIISWPLQLMFFSMMRRNNFAPKLNSRAFVIMVAMLFFFAFGHPLIVFCFMFIYLYEVTGGAQQVAIKKLIVPIGTLGAFLLFKWINPDMFDMQKINNTGGSLQGFINSTYLKEYATLYYTYPLFSISVLVVLVFVVHWFYTKQYSRTIMPIVAMLLTLFAFVYYKVYDTHPYGDLFQKIMIPIAYFYAYVITDSVRRLKMPEMQRFYKVAGIPILALVVLEVGVIAKGGISSYFNKRLDNIEALISVLPDEAHSKYYVLSSDLEDSSLALSISPMEIVLIAEMKHNKHYTPNLLVVRPDEVDYLQSFCNDNFYINYVWMGHIKHINDVNVSHNFIPGPYLQLWPYRDSGSSIVSE